MFVGLDLGTTNIKALVVDARGEVVAEGSAPVRRFCTPDGGVEQDIDEIWQSSCRALREAVGQVEAGSIRALGISSQGAAIQLLDEHDQPTARVISWLDGRGRAFDDQLTATLGEEFFARRLGRAPCTMTPGQILRLRHEAPELLARFKHLGYVGDVVVGRLCGRRAHDATSLSIAMLLNPSLSRADPEILKHLGLREEQLPELLPATQPAGALTAEAAQATGLPTGIPVSPAVHDQYAAAIGAGAVSEGDVCVGTGTAWVLLANSGRLPQRTVSGAFVCPHPVAGLYGQMLSMVNGGSALDWAMDVLGRRLSGEELDDVLGGIPPGSDGLMFWPLVTPSAEKRYGPAHGQMTGITLGHTAGHWLRAVVEGLAYELARHLMRFTETGLSVQRLVMYGAAAASRVTPQILADVTGRPVRCLQQPAASALGAATIARAMAEGDALGALARRLAPERRTVEPGEHAAVYKTMLASYLAAFGSTSQGCPK